MENILTTLRSIERLTEEQRALIGQEDPSALERNLDEKNRLIEALAGQSVDGNEEAKAVLDRIVTMERENVVALRAEMERLKARMKKTQNGLAFVRGYDALSSNIGATYIDRKN